MSISQTRKALKKPKQTKIIQFTLSDCQAYPVGVTILSLAKSKGYDGESLADAYNYLDSLCAPEVHFESDEKGLILLANDDSDLIGQDSAYSDKTFGL